MSNMQRSELPVKTHVGSDAEESKQPLVSIEGVSKRYGEASVLSTINLAVRRQELLCIVGRSGCGKSTLLNCLAGLEKYDGEIVGWREGQRRPDIPIRPGMVFQEHALFPWLTVQKNIEFGLRYATAVKGNRSDVVSQALQVTGLLAHCEKYPAELSGGMRQRVAIARCLVLNRELLLMDEPFASLDEITRDELQQELIRIWQASKSSIVFVTHSIPEAIVLATRVVVMAEGAIRDVVTVPLPYPRDVTGRAEAVYVQSVRRSLYGLDTDSVSLEGSSGR